MESLIDGGFRMWEALPWFLQWPAYFWLHIILLRGLLAQEVLEWLKQKEPFKEGLLHKLLHKIDSFVENHKEAFKRGLHSV